MAIENIVPFKRERSMTTPDNQTSQNRMKWAWGLKVGSHSVKAVLCAYAEKANSETHLAWPSIAAICDMTELNRKTVIRCIAALAEMGLLEETGEYSGATRQIPVYQVMVGNSPKSGTVKQSQNRNSSKSGTVPLFPCNSTTFSVKQSQKVPVTVPKVEHVSQSISDISQIDIGEREGVTGKKPAPAPQPPPDPPEGTQPAAQTAKAQAKATVLPADWELPQAWKDWALAERPDWTDSHAELTGRIFADYWHGKGGKDARKADWLATWRNWVRREKSFAGEKQAASKQHWGGTSRLGSLENDYLKDADWERIARGEG